MSYLLDFVRSLDERELLVFRQLDLKGKEEEIRDAYAKKAIDKTWNEYSLVEGLGISTSHLDKINSVLLDKLIQKLFGNDFSSALFSILNRGLSDLASHEVKIIERRVLAEANTDKVKEFYKAAFEHYRRMYYPNYNSKLTHEYGTKYLKALGDKKTLADESMVANLTFHADSIAHCMAGEEVKYKPQAEKYIATWEKKLKSNTDPVAEFFLAYAILSYYKYFTSDAAGFLRAAERAYKAIETSGDRIAPLFRGTILCELGFGYIENNMFKESQKYYALAINEFPDTVGKHIYHAGNYACLCVINKDFDTAAKIFESTLLPRTISNSNRSMLFDVYTVGCTIELNRGRLKEAFKYIDAMNAYQKNEITQMGQVIARLWQSLYFVLSEDYITAEALVAKNLKFLKRVKEENGAFDYHYNFFDVLSKLIRFKQGRSGSIEKIRELTDKLNKGIYMVYNNLLYQVLDKSEKRKRVST